MGVKGGKKETSVSAGFRVFDLIVNWPFVIRLGFEPRAPALKGRCSTC